MDALPLLSGITSDMIDTSRLRTHVLTAGPVASETVVLVHGNCSAARFWEETMLALAAHYRVIALDLRGFGRSEPKPIDATRGVQDWSDDLRALLETLGVRRPHLVGWSLGGAVVMQYAVSYGDDIASITLVAPASPYGFGGTRDADGVLTSPDYAGSGGGLASLDFVQRLQAGDQSADSPTSPRNVMNTLYFKPPFRSPREDVFVNEILTTVVGTGNYPGDSVPVESWPGVGPGTRGVLNALSPKFLSLDCFANIGPKPPVLWIHGDSDQIVSNRSLSDIGFLGQIGAVPGWPGPDIYPPQPMIQQLQAVLEAYTAHGGHYQAQVLADCGHSPHIEQPEAFNTAVLDFLAHV